MKDFDTKNLLESIRHAIAYHVCEIDETVELSGTSWMICGNPAKPNKREIYFIVRNEKKEIESIKAEGSWS